MAWGPAAEPLSGCHSLWSLSGTAMGTCQRAPSGREQGLSLEEISIVVRWF